MSNLNMPVKYCTDENGNAFSPVVYQESMFNDDASRMDPVPRKMFAKAYDPTKTYPTENLFCIQDNKYYKFTGSGTTTGTFDPTKWTETDDATELTTLNSTLTYKQGDSITIGGTGGYTVLTGRLGWSRGKVIFTLPLDKPASHFTSASVSGKPVIYTKDNNRECTFTYEGYFLYQNILTLRFQISATTAWTSTDDTIANIEFPSGVTLTINF